jgi:hypothetical protein
MLSEEDCETNHIGTDPTLQDVLLLLNGWSGDDYWYRLVSFRGVQPLFEFRRT